MKKEILTISVTITQMEEVKGHHQEALMILFTGEAVGPYFTGSILPGGVDTQQEKRGTPRTLSARYMLQGTDYKGQPCRIFIENNGLVEENASLFKTTPLIITDSDNLAWMETATLEGEVIPLDEGVRVSIYEIT